MKKTLGILMAAVMVLSLATFAPATKSYAASDTSSSQESSAVEVTGDAVNISYASQVGTTNNTAILEQAFFDDVAKRTNNLVTFTPFWSGSLVKAASAWSEVTA
ncbi:MAG: hypothetical protein IKG72_14550, partial [Bacillus sp. (in: Bacteria)]|nr:hypothetical protein [Bacillus sp. (in: firmicutes)]